jgi:uncharacterized protein YkwD
VNRAAKRWIVVLAGVVAWTFTAPSSMAAAPGGKGNSPGRVNHAWPSDAAREEAAFVADINALRASRGLPTLQVRANLVGKARGWAGTMAGAQKIWHSRLSAGVGARWQKLGENVGRGPSERLLQAAFIASPTHFANLVDPAFTNIGVGVVAAGGTLFVSQVFMRPASLTSGGARRPAHRPSVGVRRPPLPTGRLGAVPGRWRGASGAGL